MDNKKAEEEVSALLTGMMLIGLAIPAVMLWIAGRFSAVSEYLVSKGILERSERVLWALHGDVGLDMGRVFILVGLSLLLGIALKIVLGSIAHKR